MYNAVARLSTNISINGLEKVGGLAGDVSNTSVTDVHVSGEFDVQGSMIGGLIGNINVVSIINSSADVTIEDQFLAFHSSGGLIGSSLNSIISNSNASSSIDTRGNNIGGLVGVQFSTTILNSNTSGSIVGSENIGGLVGNSQGGSITNSFSNSSVTKSLSSSENFGGLVGYLNGTNTQNSYATGNVVGNINVGGLAGSASSANITNSYATGDVRSEGFGSTKTGGLVGYLGATVSNSYATGNVTGDAQVGGLIGHADGSIVNSFATGDVKGRFLGISGNTRGGLVGRLDGSVDRSYATGDVQGEFDIGGLVGYAAGDIRKSFATGDVNSNFTDTGGLVGELEGNYIVQDSYSIGNVNGDDNVGGLIGTSQSSSNSVTRNFSIGKVTGSFNVGGLIGNDAAFGTYPNSYWNTETSAQANGVGSGNGSGITGRTTTQMMQQANFEGFNFSSVWKIKAGETFPHHQWSNAQPISGMVFSDNIGTVKTTTSTVNIVKPSGLVDALDTYHNTGFYYSILLGENRSLDTNNVILVTTDAIANSEIIIIPVSDGQGNVHLTPDTFTIQSDIDILHSSMVGFDSFSSIMTADNNDISIGSGFNLNINAPYRFDVNGGLSVDNGFISLSKLLTIDDTITATLTQSGSSDTTFNIGGGFGANTGTLVVNGGSGADELSIDFAGTTNVSDINYNGNDPSVGPGDSLTLANSGVFNSITYNFSNNSDGNILFDRGTTSNTLTYTGLEPIFDNLSVTDRVFTFNDVSQTINLSNHASGGINTIDSLGQGESVDFSNPSDSLTINTGTGADTVNIIALDPSFAADFTLVGDDTDIILLESVPTTTNDLTISLLGVTTQSGGINIEVSSVETAGHQSYTGPILNVNVDTILKTNSTNKNITFNADINANGVDVTLDASGTIFGNGTVTADIFELINGVWDQDVDANPSLTSLPSFMANDFRLTGGTFKRFAGGDGLPATPYIIEDVYGLQGLDSPSNNLLDKHYIIANDIDASGTVNWNNPGTGALGFNPIGDFFTFFFTGSFNGMNFEVQNLSINRPLENAIGLFAVIDGSLISGDSVYDLGITNIDFNVVGLSGGLAGQTRDGISTNISNVYSTGVIAANTSSAFLGNTVGGLIGYFRGTGSIDSSYADVVVSGNKSLGGLLGISESTGFIRNSFALGDVDGTDNIGGLIGAHSETAVEDSYAFGSVSGNNGIGGLVGVADFLSSITRSYSVGTVTGTTAGGLIGIKATTGVITNNYWNTETSGLTNAHSGVAGDDTGITGLTTSQMMQQATFTNWDFEGETANGTADIWRIKAGESFPHHVWSNAQPVSGKVYIDAAGTTPVATPDTVTIVHDSSNVATLDTYHDTGFYYGLLLGAKIKKLLIRHIYPYKWIL